MTTEQSKLIQWVQEETGRLALRARDSEGTAANPGVLRAHAAGALEFLRRHAPGTQFLSSAEAVFQSDRQEYVSEGLNAVAGVLEAWSQFVREGMAEMVAFEVGARIEAATDLMEQVQQLLADNKVHPAAPVVLAGAALEEFLRSRIATLRVAVAGKPGISSYAGALRTAGDLSAQDVKDITSWAGQRNEAAHGEFELLSRERAQLMVDGINLFIRQKTT